MIYDIFLDESGLFLESSSDVQEREAHEHDDGRKFPSQIAGIVCREGVIKSGNANSMLKSACAAGGIEHQARFHANEHRGNAGFPALVESFCDLLKSKNVQPVRLVNAEEVSFGDRISTYCNILAELLVRVCQRLEEEGDSRISLKVFAAKVVATDDAKTGIEFIDQADYLARIREVFGRAAIANGVSSGRFKWSVDGFQIRSAREDRRLQLADVVSYTSHDNFWPLKDHADAASAMRSALAGFDWTFSCDETLSRVRELVNRDSYAPALIALAERAAVDGVGEDSADRYEAMANHIVCELEALPPTVQKPQFQMIAGWLNQVAEQRHDLDSSLRCCQWMQRALCDQQKSANWPTDWLELITDTWSLTACNHDANTVKGQEFSKRTEAVTPKLASRWEYADDIMFAFIARAVYLNDCFEHAAAADSMASVVGYYESLDGFFADAFDGVFPEKVLSDLRARALGTRLQAEIGRVLASQGDLDRCRQLSDQAIGEFQHEGDRARQRQYRCELETVAGDWSVARSFLSQSLDLEESTHDAIAETLRSMPNHFGKAFSLLHWTRIGSMAAAAGDRLEAGAFLDAFNRARMKHDPWCLGENPSYPTHGILRHCAVATASSGNTKGTFDYLGCLRRIVDAKPRPVFQMIQIAAHLQSAALLAKSDSKSSGLLLYGDKRRLGATSLIQQLESTVATVHPKIAEILATWRTSIGTKSKTDLDAGELLRMGRVVGY